MKPLQSTKEFVELLKNESELLIVDSEIDPYLELAELQRQVVARKGPALLFTNVKNTKFSVATNLYGSEKRIELAFGKRPKDLIKNLVHLSETLVPPSIGKLWEARNIAFQLLKIGLKKCKKPAVLQNKVNPVDLDKLPALVSWQLDGGAFITLPLVYTESPMNQKGNLGMYRIQLYDKSTTGMHIQIHRGGGFHYSEAEKLNQGLPCHIYVGGPPAMTLAAVAPLPEEISELLLASLLLGKKLNITRNRNISPLPIVSDSDFVLIGEIPPKERRAEGPFGDHYGYYSLQHDYPIFKVKSLYHRKDAIWPATVVGKPPQEDHYIAEYLQELLSPLFPIVMPGVVSVWAYEESGVHSLAACVVKERYHKEAFKSALRVLGEGQLSLSKCLFVINEPLDLRDFRKTFVTLLERINTKTDIHIFSNISQDTLDYTGPEVNKGSKMLVLGIGDKRNDLCDEVKSNFKNTTFKNPIVFCPGALVVSAQKHRVGDGIPELLLQEETTKDFIFVFIVDDSIQASLNAYEFVWTIFTRFEPAADVYGNYEIIRNHIAYSSPIVFDCRLKHWYPSVLIPDHNVQKKIEEKFGRLLEKMDDKN